MSLSVGEVVPLVSWLAGQLDGAKLQDVRLPRADTLVLTLRQPGETVHLLFATGAGRSRLHTIQRPPPNPVKALSFQGLLRKELRGTARMEAVDGDRIVRLHFTPRDEPRRTLVAELSDRHGNFFLLDENGNILGAASRPNSATRPLHNGNPWSPPPPLDRPSQQDRFERPDGEQRDADVGAHYTALDERFEFKALQQRLRSLLTRRRRSLTRRERKQEREAARGQDADPLRREGDLLQGAFHLLRKGLRELVVDDYYSDPAEKVAIELDPSLTPGQQVERRYQQARRAQRSGQQGAQRLAETRASLEAIEQELARLDAADSLDELRASETALKEIQRPGPRGKRTKKSGSRGPRLPYIVYRNPQGVELRVGRGARENDDLTFRHSRGNDVWLHVRGRPGAHVVICRPGPSPSPELLLLGAQLALAHSGIKEGAREEVTWTRVKEVQKPKGMAPGKVLVRAEKVLYVEAQRRSLDILERSPQ